MTYFAQYLGGLSTFPQAGEMQVKIHNRLRRITFTKKYEDHIINFEDIIEISFNQASTRSGGAAATGAVIGGILTGGIGLLAGAAIGGRKKDNSTLYITYNAGGRSMEIMLKTTSLSRDLYATLSAAIGTPEPAAFDKARTNTAPTSQETTESNNQSIITFIILIIVIVIIWKACL